MDDYKPVRLSSPPPQGHEDSIDLHRKRYAIKKILCSDLVLRLVLVLSLFANSVLVLFLHDGSMLCNTKSSNENDERSKFGMYFDCR